MPGYFDCYVLARERTKAAVLALLARFMPDHEPRFDLRDPAEVLGLPEGTTVAEALAHLERVPTADYTFYWANRAQAAPYFAIAAFNDDGSLVLGLSPSEEEDEALAFLEMLRELAGAADGLIGFEDPPPSSRAIFEACCRSPRRV